ncbi:hypothetical protein HBH53_164200 [Parastagonospora nodorum]|nr:hypothetical protein HBH53_164200 [Parastagonospora nodorum]KAH4044185.1 hypothetical protein HBH49_221190 [Parastagonospora nodorum]KAH5093945.1 hypothetical protein HBI73_126560 [Parastagonospora nodorum]KAH5163790.1 hypothetical protein HBH69_009260 [Parastagonospora nodorum]KAH5222752.1 hypothetical protein HBH77_026680 [Parastagonospora nodorum]
MTVLKLKRTTHAPTPSTQAHLLPRLPLELRAQIYDFAILPLCSRNNLNQVTITAADAVHGSNARYLSFLPSVCRVNKATRIDIGLWFIRQTEFSVLYVQHLVHFSQFLSTFPHNQGFAAIRRLDFQLFSRHKPSPGKPNSSVEFMKRCPELTQVHMKFDVWQLVQHEKEQWTPVDTELVMLEDIASTFGLAALLDVGSLVTLTIELWPKTIARTSMGIKVVVPDCWPAMEDVVAWLRKGFKERGKKVDVKFVESGNAGIRWYGVQQSLGMGV